MRWWFSDATYHTIAVFTFVCHVVFLGPWWMALFGFVMSSSSLWLFKRGSSYWKWTRFIVLVQLVLILAYLAVSATL